MGRKDQKLPSEARGSVKEAIGKLTGTRPGRTLVEFLLCHFAIPAAALSPLR